MTGALVLTVLGGLLAAWLWRRLSQSWLFRLLLHWFTGLPLDGVSRTNATWTRRATVVLHPSGRVVRWHHWPRLHRAGVRTGATAGLVLLLYGWIAYRTATTAALAVAASLLVLAAGWRGWVLGRRYAHHRRYVRPLARTLTRELGTPPPRLMIEPDRSRIEVGLPEDFSPTEREREAILRAVTVKLGIEAPDPEWKLAGKRPQLVCTKSEPPPATVALAAVRAEIAAAAEHEIVMGLGVKAQVTAISVDNDSPHVGLSMGSGDGKSTVAKNMAAQILYHGGLVMVLDYKLISHMWARGLPNVSYAGTPAEIEAALVWLAGEVTRRNQVALAGADIEGTVHASVGPRIFLIAEELNATQNRLKAWWNREMGEKGRSPGSEALDEVMFLGRQVHINVLQIGQRLSVKASGSGDARENLGVLIFADPTASAWKMLVGDRHAMPPASGHRGRLQVVTRRDVHATQGAFLTGAQARELATAGTVAIPPAGMPCITQRVLVPVPVTAGALPHGGPEQANVLVTSPVPTRPLGAVTLREAVEAGVFGSRSLVAVRRERGRQPDFPGEVGVEYGHHLYDVTALLTYVTERSHR